jgi:hypothetical protein
VSHVASSHTDTGIVLDHVNGRCAIYHRYADEMRACRRCGDKAVKQRGHVKTAECRDCKQIRFAIPASATSARNLGRAMVD